MPAIPYVKNPTWADNPGGGTSIDAADLNVIEAGIFEVSYAPCVRAYHNAAQSISSGSDTALALNSERFDQVANAASTMHDNSTNNTRLTCRYGGVYMITGSFEWASNAGASGCNAKIRHQGSTIIALSGAVSDLRQMVVSCIYPLAVNEYVELIARQNSGGAINVNSTASYSPEFMMVRVG